MPKLKIIMKYIIYEIYFKVSEIIQDIIYERERRTMYDMVKYKNIAQRAGAV